MIRRNLQFIIYNLQFLLVVFAVFVFVKTLPVRPVFAACSQQPSTPINPTYNGSGTNTNVPLTPLLGWTQTSWGSPLGGNSSIVYLWNKSTCSGAASWSCFQNGTGTTAQAGGASNCFQPFGGNDGTTTPLSGFSPNTTYCWTTLAYNQNCTPNFTQGANWTFTTGNPQYPPSVTGTTISLSSTPNQIQIQASGTVCQSGYPTMQLNRNGSPVQSWTNISSTAVYTYTPPNPITATDDIRVYFTNDCYNPPEDRNLQVDWVKINGQQINSVDPSVFYSICGATGSGGRNTLGCSNDYFKYSPPGGTLSVNADNTTQYLITTTASDQNGGADITQQFATINYGGAFRGLLGWDVTNWTNLWGGTASSAQVPGTNCALFTGGGTSYGYGNEFVTVDGCNSAPDTTTNPQTRTTSWTVRFKPEFIAPATNTIWGSAKDTIGTQVNFAQGATGFTLAPTKCTANALPALSPPNPLGLVAWWRLDENTTDALPQLAADAIGGNDAFGASSLYNNLVSLWKLDDTAVSSAVDSKGTNNGTGSGLGCNFNVGGYNNSLNANMVGYWKLDESTGPTYVDSLGVNNAIAP